MEILKIALSVLIPVVIFIDYRLKKTQKSSLKLQNEKIKHDFFKYFNERYDGLNNKLLLISEESDNIGEESVIMDYINLCAEEYYFFKKDTNIIDVEVFNNWYSGMKHYFLMNKFKNILMEEINDVNNKDSYYGFFESKFIKDLLK